MNIGQNLKRIRKKTKLTQNDIASCFGKDRSTYTCWETGRSNPSLENLIRLSKIFNVSIDDIIFSDEPREPGETRKSVLSEPGVDPIAYLKRNEQLLLLAFRLLDEKDKDGAIELLRNYVESKDSSSS